MIIPLLALILPLIRTVPKLYQWRIRRRFYQRYGELKYIETQIRSETTPEKHAQFLKKLDEIEDRVNHMKVPPDFTEHVFALRGHIHFVRERLLTE